MVTTGGLILVALLMPARAVTASQVNTLVFGYTGAQQTFVVPPGVTTVHVVAIGGRGGSADKSPGGTNLAKVGANLPVTPGQTLYIEVGGNGDNAGPSTNGGFNGGGPASTTDGGNGGGASDVRTVSRPPADSGPSLASRLIVAGGGGGAGGEGTFAEGGGGGGSAPDGSGQKGEDGFGMPSPGQGGGGGQDTQGGDGGSNGDAMTTACNGALGTGGCGGDGGDLATGGGGGGGGYFGGGGGGASLPVMMGATVASGGGGGGGSSFVGPSATNTSLTLDNSGVPSVTVSYTVPPTGGGPGPGPNGTPASPAVAAFTESASRWREGGALPRFSRTRQRPPIGTTFHFTLNVAASARLDFYRRTVGRKARGKCRAPTRHNRGRPHCTRTVLAGSLAFPAHAGSNAVAFQGRLARTKKLKPGRYTLVISATSLGRRSPPRSLRFTIVKG